MKGYIYLLDGKVRTETKEEIKQHSSINDAIEYMRSKGYILQSTVFIKNLYKYTWVRKDEKN